MRPEAHAHKIPEQIQNAAEQIVLRLIGGGVANPHRAAASIAAQIGDDRFRRRQVPLHRIQGAQQLRAGRLRQPPAQPAQEIQRLPDAAQANQRLHGHGRIPGPAIAVVPIAHAAHFLRQAGGGGGQHRAAGFVAQALQDEGAAADDFPVPGGQNQPLRPLPPMGFGAPPRRAGSALGGGAQMVAAQPQLQLHRRAGRKLHPPQRPAAAQGSPSHARRPQGHLIGAAGNQNAFLGQFQQRMAAPEIGTGRELHQGGALPGQHPVQDVGALFQEIRDLHAFPSRLQSEAGAQIALARRLSGLRFRAHREHAATSAAQEFGEQRRGIRPGMAQPDHPGIPGEHGRGLAVGQEAQALDGRIAAALHPFLALLAEQAEQFRHLLGASDAELRSGLALPHLDAQIRPPKALEGFLVGQIVAQEQHGFGRQAMAQPVQRRALVVPHHQGLEDHLAQLQLNAAHALQGGARLSFNRAAPIGGATAVVQRHGGRLGFQERPLVPLGDGAELRLDGSQAIQAHRGEFLHEAHIEFRAVAAHQMDFLGQARQRGEVAQRPPGDHRHASVGQPGQGPQRHAGFPQRARLERILDDGREGSIVVGGDQQQGRLRQGPQPLRQLRGQAHGARRCCRQPTKERTQACTSLAATAARILRMAGAASSLDRRTASSIARFMPSMS